MLTSFLPFKSSLFNFGKKCYTLPVQQIQNNVTRRLMASQASNPRNFNHCFGNRNIAEQSSNDNKNILPQILDKEIYECDVQKNVTQNIKLRGERIDPEFKKLLDAYGPPVPAIRPHKPKPKIKIQKIPNDYEEPKEDEGRWKKIRAYFTKLFEIQSRLSEDREGPRKYNIKSSKPRSYFFSYTYDSPPESNISLAAATSKKAGPFNQRMRSFRIEPENITKEKPCDSTPYYLRVHSINDDGPDKSLDNSKNKKGQKNQKKISNKPCIVYTKNDADQRNKNQKLK